MRMTTNDDKLRNISASLLLVQYLILTTESLVDFLSAKT